MPRYDYACACGSVVEEVRGYDESVIPCPSCGREARRAPIYAEQSIRGDTVPKGIATRRGNVKSPKGKYRVSLFQEASAEVAHEAEKHEQPVPNLYKAALNRARAMGVPIRGGPK